jgi:chromosome partitioning protein
MFLVPSNPALTGAEIELVELPQREFRLRKSLESVRNDYDFIFIDCPPSLGLLTLNCLVAADSVIIPLQCEYYALEGLSQLMDTITLVRRGLNPALEIEGVILTMADFRTRLTDEVIKEVQAFFKAKVFTTIIPRSIKLSEAPGFGKPILVYDPYSVGAQKYDLLSGELLSRNPEDRMFTQGSAERMPAMEETVKNTDVCRKDPDSESIGDADYQGMAGSNSAG